MNIFFPDLYNRIDQFKDPRGRGCDYTLAELIMGGIAMSLLKCSSRHDMNTRRGERRFLNNYRRLFNLRLPHMDTVNAVLENIDENELEMLKAEMIKSLIEKKVFHKFKLFGSSFSIAVDATGVYTFKTQVFKESTKKEYTSFCLDTESYNALSSILESPIGLLKPLINERYKQIDKLENEIKRRLGEPFFEEHKDVILSVITCRSKVCYFQNVLEAKLIGSNGFSISLATQWIENPSSGHYNKQDCEQKAFVRMAKKIKSMFPRLPICIVTDGLYPNKTFFDICKKNGWAFICAFQEGNLKSIRTEIECLQSLNHDKTTDTWVRIGNEEIECTYHWINDLPYENHSLHWVKCEEKKTNVNSRKEASTNYEYLCSQAISTDTVCEWVKMGRLRQNIEDSFNTQKNRGYGLQHKFSRSSLKAVKNFYQCMQIAHMINQLCELSEPVQQRLKSWGDTLEYLWSLLKGALALVDIQEDALLALIEHQTQYRYT